MIYSTVPILQQKYTSSKLAIPCDTDSGIRLLYQFRALMSDKEGKLVLKKFLSTHLF